MLKFSRENESGRSMVEMLGVLAIIGVLSVMGIAGYTIAMNAHHANEVLNQVNRMAILISAERQLHGGVGSPTSDSNPYNVTLDQTKTNQIVLTATDVPAKAADRLANMSLSVPQISANGTTVTFTFNNDLGEESTSSGMSDAEITAAIDEFDEYNSYSAEAKAAIFSCVKTHQNDYSDPVSCCACSYFSGGFENCQYAPVCQTPQ